MTKPLPLSTVSLFSLCHILPGPDVMIPVIDNTTRTRKVEMLNHLKSDDRIDSITRTLHRAYILPTQICKKSESVPKVKVAHIYIFRFMPCFYIFSDPGLTYKSPESSSKL
ncbi:hypothetical protein KC19_11G009800 [Ceratodon purpureus]|uniref:Uncharacterized protein n=1 Tax=Ceratodon purpureus TaxID=3225 RepID=A0A8T0G9U3_CERPU|nr:hypothetical protein KC19_11G009800 [Ceratodon purpureus]